MNKLAPNFRGDQRQEITVVSPEAPQEWRVRGLRGATTVSQNSAEAIAEAVDELVTALEELNPFHPDEVVSAIFSVTSDLDGLLPATAARRRPGWQYIPLLDTQQPQVVGSLNYCIRVLIHLNTCLPQQALCHAYLRRAAALRPDLGIANQLR